MALASVILYSIPLKKRTQILPMHKKPPSRGLFFILTLYETLQQMKIMASFIYQKKITLL